MPKNKNKQRRVHKNKYEQFSKVDEVKRTLEEIEKKKARKPRKLQRKIVGNVYGGGTSLYRFYVQPEGYSIDFHGEICVEDNDLSSRLF